MCKTISMINEIMSKYHPDFQKSDILMEMSKTNPKAFNVEHLIEQTMAIVGGYDFIDGEHCDFSDGSECKTASVSPNPQKASSNSHRLEISNIVSIGGAMKSGDIRLVVYNPNIEAPKCSFYYIPNDKLEDLGINYHPTTGMGRIFCTWNSKKNYIPKLQAYEVCCFKALAMKKRKG